MNAHSGPSSECATRTSARSASAARTRSPHSGSSTRSRAAQPYSTTHSQAHPGTALSPLRSGALKMNTIQMRYTWIWRKTRSLTLRSTAWRFGEQSIKRTAWLKRLKTWTRRTLALRRPSSSSSYLACIRLLICMLRLIFIMQRLTVNNLTMLCILTLLAGTQID